MFRNCRAYKSFYYELIMIVITIINKRSENWLSDGHARLYHTLSVNECLTNEPTAATAAAIGDLAQIVLTITHYGDVYCTTKRLWIYPTEKKLLERSNR